MPLGDQQPPLGIVLAGGSGRRIGGGKASVVLAGRPLIAYPIAALRAVLADVVVVAKPATELPTLTPGIAVWREPSEPSHPLVGIVEALQRAEGRAVLVCAGDMPFVPVSVLATLLGVDRGAAPAVLAASPDGGLQPLLGCYFPAALARMRPAAAQGVAPVRAVAAALAPAVVVVDEPSALFNVNSAADLRVAEQMLTASRPGGDQPKVKS